MVPGFGFVVTLFVIFAVVMGVAVAAIIYFAARTLQRNSGGNGTGGGHTRATTHSACGTVRQTGLFPTATNLQQDALWQNTMIPNAPVEHHQELNYNDSHHHAAPAAVTIHPHDTSHHQPQPTPEVHHAATAYQPPMPDIPAPTFDAGMHHGGHGM